MPNNEDNEGTKARRRGRGADGHEIPKELVDQLLGEYQGPEDLTGPDGLLKRLTAAVLNRVRNPVNPIT